MVILVNRKAPIMKERKVQIKKVETNHNIKKTKTKQKTGALRFPFFVFLTHISNSYLNNIHLSINSTYKSENLKIVWLSYFNPTVRYSLMAKVLIINSLWNVHILNFKFCFSFLDFIFSEANNQNSWIVEWGIL